jgi:hypothetical protein
MEDLVRSWRHFGIVSNWANLTEGAILTNLKMAFQIYNYLCTWDVFHINDEMELTVLLIPIPHICELSFKLESLYLLQTQQYTECAEGANYVQCLIH